MWLKRTYLWETPYTSWSSLILEILLQLRRTSLLSLYLGISIVPASPQRRPSLKSWRTNLVLSKTCWGGWLRYFTFRTGPTCTFGHVDPINNYFSDLNISWASVITLCSSLIMVGFSNRTMNASTYWTLSLAEVRCCPSSWSKPGPGCSWWRTATSSWPPHSPGHSTSLSSTVWPSSTWSRSSPPWRSSWTGGRSAPASVCLAGGWPPLEAVSCCWEACWWSWWRWPGRGRTSPTPRCCC